MGFSDLPNIERGWKKKSDLGLKGQRDLQVTSGATPKYLRLIRGLLGGNRGQTRKLPQKSRGRWFFRFKSFHLEIVGIQIIF